VIGNSCNSGEGPVGKIIRIKNVPFCIIRVQAPRGPSPSGNDQDDVIFIPFTTTELRVLGTQFLGSVGPCLLRRNAPRGSSAAAEGIRPILQDRHRLQGNQPDDFTIRTQIDSRKAQEGTGETLPIMGVLNNEDFHVPICPE
jgi:putative ABC transport system permease protein